MFIENFPSLAFDGKEYVDTADLIEGVKERFFKR